MKTALLVIDIQTALIEAKPYAVDNCLSVWQKAIATCRETNIEVIYVRHNDDELLTGSHGWEVYGAIAPEADEKIFDKHYNCLLYTSPSPRDRQKSRMPSSA